MDKDESHTNESKVKIKPLEWVEMYTSLPHQSGFKAETSVGVVEVFALLPSSWGIKQHNFPMIEKPSLKDARTYVQNLHEEQVRKWIETE